MKLNNIIGHSAATGIVLLALTACQTQPVTPEPGKAEGSASGVYTYQLDNGLNILVKPDHRSPVAVSQVWYKVGGSYEYAGVHGCLHALEHMMFKGTEELKPGEFSEIIAANGGSENAFTGKDYTAYFQRISSDRLELCLKHEADRMRHLQLMKMSLKKKSK